MGWGLNHVANHNPSFKIATANQLCRSDISIKLYNISPSDAAQKSFEYMVASDNSITIFDAHDHQCMNIYNKKLNP